MLGVEAIRTAQEKFGKKPLTGEQVRWGLENLNLTAERLKQLGFENELKVSCADHEGTRTGRIQTWDGKKWNIASDWITADDSVIAPTMLPESATERYQLVVDGEYYSARRAQQVTKEVSYANLNEMPAIDIAKYLGNVARDNR